MNNENTSDKNQAQALNKTDVSHSNSEILTKHEIISITDKLSIHFIYVPIGYKVSNLSLSEHEVVKLTRLKNLNRSKLLHKWKLKVGNLSDFFAKQLKYKDWDFEKYPNPIAFASYYCG